MKNLLKKFLVLLTGLFIILLIAEIFLRIAGFIYENKHSSDSGANNKSNYNILCIGDSHTHGFAIDPKDSYPSQLEKMLNSRLKTEDTKQKAFKVLNKGVVTQNTAQALDVMQRRIDEYKPDMIVLLTGGSNHWNYYGYHSQNEEDGGSSSFRNFLYKIRLYKLAVLLAKNIKDQYFHSERNKEEIVPIVSEKELDSLNIEMKNKPNDVLSYYNIGLYYYRRQDTKNAIEWFEKGIAVDPYFGNNYLFINLAFTYYQNDYKGSTEWLLNRVKITPNFILLAELLYSNYRMVGNLSEADRWQKEKERLKSEGGIEARLKIEKPRLNSLEQKASEIDPRIVGRITSPVGSLMGFYNFGGGINENKLLNENMEPVLSWIRSDVRKMIEICEKNKVKLIILDYAVKPEISSWTTIAQLVNGILKSCAEEYSIPFVDNEQIFNYLGARQREYFVVASNDAHPNPRGYTLMAKNIMDKIIEEKMFDVHFGEDIRH